jgi:peptide/nickel transport system substrate-binding protein/oligopeptide transport system substrate-binding protein
MSASSWIGDFADPLTFLQMWISDSNVNDAGFSDPRYDELIDRSMVQSGTQRYETLSSAEEILLQSGTVLPISHSPSINLIDLRAVNGWYPNPLDIHPFRYLEFTDRVPVPGVVRFDDGTVFSVYSRR